MKKVIPVIMLICMMTSPLFAGGSQEAGQKPGPVKETGKKFPSKPIQMIVPFAAGGGSDITARAIAKLSEKTFGQTMVIINRAGGSGAIGTDAAAHAAPDGYTVVFAKAHTVCVLPHYGNLNYKHSDLEPIAYVNSDPIVLVAKKGRFNTLDDLITEAKAKPGAIKYGLAVAGALPHIFMEQFASMMKTDMKVVGFKGAAEVLPALLGGHLDLAALIPIEAKPHYDAGTMSVLSVAAGNRFSLFPDAPTFKEKGIDLEMSIWGAILGPKGMPEDVKKTLNEGFKTILTDSQLIKEQAAAGQYIEYKGPKELGEIIERDNVYYAEVIKQTGMLKKMQMK